MGELTIRRRMGVAVPQYQGTTKTEKKSGSSRSQATSRTTVTISETLRQLMSRVSQAEGHARESRRTLQAGEGALAGVQDSLERIAQLARQSAGGGQPDRAALQAELEGLRDEIDRILSSAVSGGTQLFLDEDAGADDGAEVLLYTLSGEPAPSEEAVQELPDWLVKGITQTALTPEQLLAGLGLDVILVVSLTGRDRVDRGLLPPGTRLLELYPSQPLEPAPSAGTMDFSRPHIRWRRELGLEDGRRFLKEQLGV